MPYIQGIIDKITKVLKKRNIGATFKPFTMIRNPLKSVLRPQLAPSP
jgi:hypothetical protein